MALHGPPQDIFPKECVYTHDPTGLNVLKKGCASYCNQTILVSAGMSGHCVVARGLPSGAGQAAFLGQLCCTPEGLHLALRWGVGAAAAWAVGVARPRCTLALSLTETWLLQRIFWARLCPVSRGLLQPLLWQRQRESPCPKGRRVSQPRTPSVSEPSLPLWPPVSYVQAVEAGSDCFLCFIKK